MTRANPFDNLGDFTAKSQAKPVESQQIERITTEMGFSSRQPVATLAHPRETLARRRCTTDRNQQLSVKATAETVARFHHLADHKASL